MNMRNWGNDNHKQIMNYVSEPKCFIGLWHFNVFQIDLNKKKYRILSFLELNSIVILYIISIYIQWIPINMADCSFAIQITNNFFFSSLFIWINRLLYYTKLFQIYHRFEYMNETKYYATTKNKTINNNKKRKTIIRQSERQSGKHESHISKSVTNDTYDESEWWRRTITMTV